MDLYLQDYSPRSATVGSYVDVYDIVRSKRSIGDDRSLLVRLTVNLAIILSTALKIYSLIVFFSRMQVQAFLLMPDKTRTDGQKEVEVFSDFITDFSFPEMVRDFWKAEAYFVATVIVMGSAVVPLAKHLYMFLVWNLPIPVEWHHIRRHGLFLFDQTGRTALVDLFLLGYVICIFYTKVVQNVGGYGVEIMLSGQPVRGIFCGIASTFTASFLSHFLLLAHDKQNLGEFDRRVTIAAGPAVASLMQRLYASPVSLTYKRLCNLSVTLLIIASGLCLGILAGESYEVVAFHLEGLAGSVANSEWREFNLLTAANNMPKNSNEVTGTWVLAVLHVALVIVVPATFLWVAIILWFVPIHLRPQRRLLSIFPFWFSWCALDVFLVTSFAAFLEMHLIAEFIFDKNFHTLCSTLKRVGVTCVELGHEQGPGLYILVLCCGLLFLVYVFISRLGNSLLETASNGFDQQSPSSLQLSPSWDDLNGSPLLSGHFATEANEFVVLNGGATASPSPGVSSSAITPRTAEKKLNSASFW